MHSLSIHRPKIGFLITLFFVAVFIFLNAPKVYGAPCGNGVCQASQSETCSTCPADCGTCPVPTSTPITTPQPTTPQPTPTTQTSSPSPTSSDSTGSTDSSSSNSNSSGTSSTTATPAITYYPSISLNPYLPNPTNRTALTFSGSSAISSGTISGVEYTITGGSEWLTAVPNDGSFNSSTESFAFTTPSLSEGVHTILVRAKSDSGIYTQSGSYASGTVTIITTPPSVTLDKISPNPTSNQKPVISGTVSSRLGTILKIEVSLDAGATWNTGSIQRGKFSFKSSKTLEDGNYSLLARASDNAGNIGTSNRQILIIDTIPPLIGGSSMALGSIILPPKSNGEIHAVSESKVTITTSMKGGVTEAYLFSNNTKYPLSPIMGTAFWSGKVVFKENGQKILKVFALDGAGNKTERFFNSFFVEPSGIILDNENQKPIPNATVSLFFYDNISKKWVLWEADSFGQKNPQVTLSNGKYTFMISPGKYYMEVKATGYRSAQSNIFKTANTAIVNQSIHMDSAPHISISLPFIGENVLSLSGFYFPKTVDVQGLSEKNTIHTETTSTLLTTGASVPKFSLPDRNNKLKSPADYLGKKMLLSFFSSWSPDSLEQASILNNLQKTLKPDQEILVIFLQDSQGVTEAFLNRGKYTFNALSDKDGITAESYKVTLLPAHFFINKKGNIAEVHIGSLTKEVLIEKFNNVN